MAFSDDEFYQARKFSPEDYHEPPRQRGCFFYGCLIASVLAVLLLVAGGAVFYLAYRAVGRFVEEYTATIPRQLPVIEMPAEQRQSLQERVQAFRKALEEGTPTEPLVLTGDDINALLEDNSTLKGKLYVTFEGDKVKADVSLPLVDLVDIGLTRGRYLNGEAELKASLKEGVLIVTLESFEVNGKRPPDQFLADLRRQNLAKDAYKDPENAEQIRKLESIEIKDGKMIIKPRAREAEPVSKAEEFQEDLPDDVLTPAGPDRARPGPSGSAAARADPSRAEVKSAAGREPPRNP